MGTATRTTKRSPGHSTQQRNKRQRDNSTSSSFTLQHYFQKTCSTQTQVSTSSSTQGATQQAPSSFQSDLERAIAMSLAENASVPAADGSDRAGSAKYGSDNPTAAESASTATENENANGLTESLCPVCQTSIAADTVDAMNQHINRCLDGESQPEQQDESTVTASNPTKASTSRNLFRTVENAIREVLSPKDNSDAACWKAAASSNNALTSNKNHSSAHGKKKRSCPFYKWIHDTPYVVDAFSYGKIPDCAGYFLSHFHSDHYVGLGKMWSHGTIYCSKITANLVQRQLRVSQRYICALPMNEKYALSETINVSLIDANHCPGSVLFLFEVMRPDGVVVRHLHTGDFRATPRMCLHPLIRQIDNRPPIDTLYLDTTYLDGNYAFPAQEEVIRAACDVAENLCFGKPVQQLLDLKPAAQKQKPGALAGWLQSQTPHEQLLSDDSEGTLAAFKNPSPAQPKSKVLVVVGTYVIGKEKVFFNVAKRLGSKIYVPENKRKALACQENHELDSLLTKHPHEAQVHVMPLGNLRIDTLEEYLKTVRPHFTSIVAFRPTGWTFRSQQGSSTKRSAADRPLSDIIAPPNDRTITLRPIQASTDTVKIFGIPYSEHSSFRELAAFICSLDIRRIIPTVNNGNESSRQKMRAILDRWQQEKKKEKPGVVDHPSEDYW